MSPRSSLPPVFVVGTGRCGSTLLSQCLRSHPDILSLSETLVFATDLGGRIAEAFPEGEVGGEALWSILGAPHPRQTLMLRHDVMMDEALYRPGPGRRYTAETGVPALMATTLPHLTDEPEGMFDRLETFTRALPPADIATQYRRLFDEMRDRARARVWVERSGGTLRVVERLRRHFPEARFVHIVRDGRDTALSMSRHLGFRMALIAAQLTEILGVDPYENPDRRYIDDVPDDLVRFLPERFDAAAFRDEAVAVPLCGHYWAGEIAAGLEALRGLEAGHLLTLRFEDILRAPRAELARLFEFILGDAAPAARLDALAATVRAPRSAWQSLPPGERAQLESACRPGFEALNAAGLG